MPCLCVLICLTTAGRFGSSNINSERFPEGSTISCLNAGSPCNCALYAFCLSPTPYHQSCQLLPLACSVVSVLTAFFLASTTISPSLPRTRCQIVFFSLSKDSAAVAISLSAALGAFAFMASRNAFG